MGGVEVEVRGTDMVGLRKAIAGMDKEMKSAISARVRKSVPDVEKFMRNSALRTLPKSGRLNQYVGETLKVRGRVTVGGRGVVMKLEASVPKTKAKKYSVGKGVRKYKKYGPTVDLLRIDRGRVAHPVFGRGKLQYQNVKPGFWTDQIRGEAGDRVINEIREAVVDAVTQVARDMNAVKETK